MPVEDGQKIERRGLNEYIKIKEKSTLARQNFRKPSLPQSLRLSRANGSPPPIVRREPLLQPVTQDTRLTERKVEATKHLWTPPLHDRHDCGTHVGCEMPEHAIKVQSPDIVRVRLVGADELISSELDRAMEEVLWLDNWRRVSREKRRCIYT